MKYGARGIQAAAKAKATEMRQWDTSKDIDDNLEVLDGLVTNLRSENQAMQLNDYPCKVISMVKTYRFNRRQEAKLKGLQLELEEKMTGLGLADEDENGNMVCNPDQSLCHRVKKKHQHANDDMLQAQFAMFHVNRFADQEMDWRGRLTNRTATVNDHECVE